MGNNLRAAINRINFVTADINQIKKRGDKRGINELGTF